MRVFVCCAGTAACGKRQRRFIHSSTKILAAWLATKERRCPGKKIKRGRCVESLKEGAKERKRKRGSIWERKSEQASVRVFIFCYKLFKGYILPSKHLGMRVKVEEFLLLFAIPPNLFCWFLFFPFLSFLFSPHPCPPFTLGTRNSAAVLQLTSPDIIIHWYLVFGFFFFLFF